MASHYNLDPLLKRCAALPLLFAAAMFSGWATAGRPLVVDDANVNEPGAGHVEAWAARASGVSAYNLAPAYAPVEGLELGALLAREPRASVTLAALQAKWRITPSREKGCNLGLVGGIARATITANSLYLNGLLTCNHPDLGSTHLNLGTSRLRHSQSISGWGIAYERQFGSATPHMEWFGAEQSKPTFQVGVRTELWKNVQLDGSVGRSGGTSVYTLGSKLSF